MAGKKKNHRAKFHMNKLNLHRKKDEQAATVENTNKSFGTFREISNHSGLWKKRQNANLVKPVMLAVISALVIGSILGIIMLRMFVTMDGSPGLSGNNNPAAVSMDDAGEENTEHTLENELQTKELDAIDAYVLQAGVFSERENAEKLAESYEAANIPVMIWNRDDLYYLFAGVTSTAEEAEKAAGQLEAKELELYSKAWDTDAVELLLTGNEEEWLHAYTTWWHQAIAADAGEESASDLEQLTETFTDESNELTGLYEKLEVVQRENEITDKNLLELWHIYETLGE
ncbi:SPOR domain-containing protein [Virgibacillus kimchii]